FAQGFLRSLFCRARVMFAVVRAETAVQLFICDFFAGRHFCHPEEAESLACERLPTKDLCVVAQEVVPIQTSPADGRSVIETSMRPVPVVLVQPGGKLGGAKPRVVIGASISPLPQRGLDKAFRLAVGARGVGAGEALGDAELATGAAKAARAVARSVVGQYPVDADAEA